jgi:hypothetical protein
MVGYRYSDGGMMQSLWRAMALAWLGGLASPALAQDAVSLENMSEERPLETNVATGQVTDPGAYGGSPTDRHHVNGTALQSRIRFRGDGVRATTESTWNDGR